MQNAVCLCHDTDATKLSSCVELSQVGVVGVNWSIATLAVVAELFRSPLLVSEIVCLNALTPHSPWLSSDSVSRPIFPPTLVFKL